MDCGIGHRAHSRHPACGKNKLTLSTPMPARRIAHTLVLLFSAAALMRTLP